jgi:hypothetical protein
MQCDRRDWAAERVRLGVRRRTCFGFRQFGPRANREQLMWLAVHLALGSHRLTSIGRTRKKPCYASLSAVSSHSANSQLYIRSVALRLHHANHRLSYAQTPPNRRKLHNRTQSHDIAASLDGVAATRGRLERRGFRRGRHTQLRPYCVAAGRCQAD